MSLKAIGIVCELNPMHQGHVHLVQTCKSQYDAVVGILSGPFVQRGEPAILDPFSRAQLAIKNGFDLILQLPTCFSLQSAHFFARGAIQHLKELSSIQAIGFATEPDFPLSRLKELLQEELKEHHRLKNPRSLSLRRFYDAQLSKPLGPNTLLALEYLRALSAFSLSWDILCIPRIGADYADASLNHPFPSASAFRRHILDGDEKPWRDLKLQGASSLRFLSPPNTQLLRGALLARLTENINWSDYPEYAEGMENRLRTSLLQFPYEEAIRQAANKRHTESRYRRFACSLLVGSTKDVAQESISPYLRVLAMNEKGKTLLRHTNAPRIQKHAEPLSNLQRARYAVDQNADCWSQCLSSPWPQSLARQRFFISSEPFCVRSAEAD